MDQATPDQIAEYAWASHPHLFAQHLSKKWKPYPYLVKISEEIVAGIIQGKGRFIFNMPPRHGKSELISKYTPAWFLNLFPDKNVILASYEADFAATWGRHVRNILGESNLFDTRISGDSSAANRFNLIQGGGMVTAGVGGAITGRGADLLLIDDPVKNWADAKSPTKQKTTIDWFNSTLYTRGEDSATIIVLQTRWDENDLAGYLINEHTDDWKVFNFPALAHDNDILGRKEGEALCPDRYPTESLLNTKKAVGSTIWAALYDGNPTPDEGVKFKRDWLRFYRRAELPEMDMIVLSWDYSFDEGEENDYNVGQVWGFKDRKCYLLWQIREKAAFIRQCEMTRFAVKTWPRYLSMLIEKKANGAALIDTLKPTIHGIIEIDPVESKEVRADFVTPIWEAGDVLLPDPSEEPWVEAFISEVLKFPRGKHDDQVDPMTQVLRWFSAQREPNIRELGK